MSLRYKGGLISPSVDPLAANITTSPNVAQYNGVFTLQQQAQALNAGQWAIDPYYKNTTLLLHADGKANGSQNNTFLDSSTNNFTITRNGNTTQGSFTPYGPDWSSYSNSANTNCVGIYLNGESDFAFSTGDFTIEMWVNLYDVGRNQVIYDSRPDAGNGLYPTIYYDSATGKLKYYTNSADRITQTSSFVFQVWHHVVLTRTGTNTKLFIDGVQQGSTYTDSNSYINGTSRPFTGDGSNPNPTGGGGSGVQGFISNLRVVKGSGPYQSAGSTITVPTTPLTPVTNTVLLTLQSNRYVDTNTQTTAKTINLYNGPTIQRFSPFPPQYQYTPAVIGGSGYFDGSGDYLSGPTNAAFYFGTADFTVEAWIYPTVSGASFGIWTNGPTSAGSFGFYLNSGKIRCDYYGGTGIEGTTSIIANQWNHVAVSHSGTTLSLYLNGNRDATTTTTSDNTTNSCVIGRSWTNYASGEANGYISNLRIIKSQGLYTGTTYTIPNAPLTLTGYGSTSQGITGTISLLCSMTNGGITDNAMMNNLETVGTAQVSTSVVKYGSGSLQFGGSDWLTIPWNQASNFYKGDFTVEAWVNPNRTAGNAALICGIWDDVTPANQSWYLYISTAGKLELIVTSPNTVTVSSSSTITNNVWTHVAVTRSGSNWYGFINGLLVSTASNSMVIQSGTNPFQIGSYPTTNTAYRFNGYIDDLRITKGVARYTANFQPPKVAFANQ